MDHRPITDSFSAAPQISPADITTAKAEGYTHIICNRPDDEDANQPSADMNAEHAKAEGLGFDHIPVGRDGLSTEDITRTLAAMAAPGRILAYCRTGTRSAILHALARAKAGENVESIIADAGAAGYDLSAYAERLTAITS